MDETHLSVFHSVSNCARGKCSRNSIFSSARYKLSTRFCFVLFFFRFLEPWSKDCMTFTLHDLTDSYIERVESVTVQRTTLK